MGEGERGVGIREEGINWEVCNSVAVH
jgi:hypothetical protein